MVYAAVSDLGHAAEHAPKVMKSAESVRLDLGEDAAGLYGEVKLRAGSEQDVRNMADFGKGLVALGRMAVAGEDDLKDLAKVMDGVTIDASGLELTASFRIGRDLLNAALDEVKSHHDKGSKPAIEKTSKEKKN